MMQANWTRWLPPFLAMVAVLVGLCGDIWAGSLVLAGEPWIGILVHFPAAIIWGVGLGLLDRPVSRTDSLLSGRFLVGVLLSLILFPGLAALGYGLPALTLAGWRHFRRASTDGDASLAVVDDFLEEARAEPIPDAPTLLRALRVQPFVEILNEPDVERRRVVIGMLGRDGGPTAIGLLRSLLNDPHPDIRSDAAVELTRLEDVISRKLALAADEARAHPADLPIQREFARQQLEYAHSGLLDEPSARYYLLKARETLLGVVTIDPDSITSWRDFAYTCHELGDQPGFAIALDTLKQLGAATIGDALLEMEDAYIERDWGRLATLAQQTLPTQDEETNALLVMWAQADRAQHDRVA